MRSRTRLIMALTCFLTTGNPARAQDDPARSLLDPRLESLKRASSAWEGRRGPTRTVIDQVVIVPDVPTFLEAMTEWDSETWFPILIEDMELVPKFLRDFAPRRVVRFLPKISKPPAARLWDEAARAVEQSWLKSGERSPSAAPSQQGRILPKSLGSTPPGVVLSASTSESLAGAVALAAGRFQPLVRWETKSSGQDKPNMTEAVALARELEAVVAEVAPRHGTLGDDCDFLTLAADYPSRYNLTGKVVREGEAAFDDMIGRDFTTGKRWAFAGRLEGNAAQSVYRAMCSLFLQPSSALLFDAYSASDAPFQPYLMKAAAASASEMMKVETIASPNALLSAWHNALKASNPFSLVYINSRGTPTMFGIDRGEEGFWVDVPPTRPTVVIMNHSYSAAYPRDPKTLAGSWLAGGAYLYFGSLNEPYIQAFRTPSLVLSLLKDRIPIAAAVRLLPEENPAFGTPWRLHLLGDPLFRIDKRAHDRPRLEGPAVKAPWVVLQEKTAPLAKATEEDRLAWATTSTFLDAAANRRRDAVEQAVLKIRRASLSPASKLKFDGLLLDLWSLGLPKSLKAVAKLQEIPPKERSPRANESLLRSHVASIQMSMDKGNWPQAWAEWEAFVLSNADLPIKQGLTTRVGRISVRAGKGGQWKSLLEKGTRSRVPDAGLCCREELARLAKS